MSFGLQDRASIHQTAHLCMLDQTGSLFVMFFCSIVLLREAAALRECQILTVPI